MTTTAIPTTCGLAALALCGCVAYAPADVEPARIAERLPTTVDAPLTFATAARLVLRQNPRLQALAAAARAAGADVAATEIEAEWRSGEETLAVMVDPVALLRLGARGADAALADADAAAAMAELAMARWRALAELAEAFTVLAVLPTVAPPGLDLDPAPFVQAGLASPTAAAAVAAARAALDAERQELDALATTTLARLRTLLGVHPSTPLTPDLTTMPALPAPEPTEAAVLRRPDLAFELTRYRQADAGFRLAVAEQYPSLQIGPELPLRGGAVDAMAILRVPLFADGPARAARDRREAARASLTAAYLDAAADATTATAESAATAAVQTARSLAAATARQNLLAAIVAVQTDVDAFERLAEAAPMAAREAMELRLATVAAARARVRAAAACGWPNTEERP